MNTPKKSTANAPVNNDWILCPSKRFSGKYYYFNAATGKSTWSLNNEKSNPKKENSNIEKLNDSFHGFPEPTTPPENNVDISTTNNWPSISTSNPWPGYRRPAIQYNRFPPQSPTPISWPQYKMNPFENGCFFQQPMFGQPSQFITNLGQFVPGMPNVSMPNFLWTPTPLPTSGWSDWPSGGKLAVDRDTQTPHMDREIQTPHMDREVIVHTSGVPMSQKFVNFEIPSLCFNKENKIINEAMSSKTSTSMKRSNSETVLFENQVPISKPIPEHILNAEMKTCDVGNLALVTPNNVENSDCDARSTSNNNYIGNLTFSPKDKIEFPNMKQNQGQMQILRTDEPQKKCKKDLQKSDLRFLLLAKRRKVQYPVETKNIKVIDNQSLPKKKVTFNLKDYNDASSSTNDEDNYNPKTSTTDNVGNSANMSTLPNIPARNMPTHNTPRNEISIGTPKQNIRPRTHSPILFDTTHNTPRNEISIGTPKQNIRPRTHSPILFDTTRNTPRNEISIGTPKQNIRPRTHSPILFGTRTPSEPNKMPNKAQFVGLVNPTNCIVTIKEEAKNMPSNNNKAVENAKNKAISDDYGTTLSIELSKSMLSKENDIEETTFKEVPAPFGEREIWYIVADMDVLLEHLVVIDGLLKSDEKCRLLIPHCIHTQVDAICIGDCQGQKRVLVARQLSRRMTAPHKQYVVEPPLDEDNTGTADGVLKCCLRVMQNKHNVILVTNNMILKARANVINIRCYSTKDIQNGAIVKPKLFADLKKMKVTVDNDTTDKNLEGQSSEVAVTENIPVVAYKKQLFVENNQKNKNCDILINITKPKIVTNPISDSNVTIRDIDDRIQHLNYEKTAANPDFNNQSPFFTQAIAHKSITNSQENRNMKCDVKPDSNISSLNKVITNSKFDAFQFGNPESKKYKSVKNYSTSNDNELNQEYKINTAAKQRINNIISAINPKPSKMNTNQKDSNQILQSWNQFKNPNLLPFEQDTRIASTHDVSSTSTDEIHSNFENSKQWLKDGLKKFSVKNQMMHEEIITRMDEWACTYTQIMENFFGDLLQNNTKYLKKIKASDRTLAELLTFVKMIYDDVKLKAIAEVLLELLTKCTCGKGKIKWDTAPNDFMKMVGCGVMLLKAFENILPDFKERVYYESLLYILVSNIETKLEDMDPELNHPAAVCRSEILPKNKMTRYNFAKEPSMIIEYLKKHYKEWSSYDGNQTGDYNVSRKSPNENIKVLRVFGKNVNMLKIDSNKSLSYNKSGNENISHNKSTKDNNSFTKTDSDTKVLRLLRSTKPNADSIHTDCIQNSKLQNKFSIEKQPNKFDLNNTVKYAEDQSRSNTEPKIIRHIENITPCNEYEDEECGHTFARKDEVKAGPKIVRNFKIIDAHENKIKNKEPLDLDLLDYSEINDNTVDVLFGKSNEVDKNNSENSEKSNELSKYFENQDLNYINAIFETSKAGSNDLFSYYKANLHENDVNMKNSNVGKKGNDLFTERNISPILNKPNASNKERNLKNFECHKKCSKFEVNEQDGSMNESEFENSSIRSQAYEFVKMFLCELSGTFVDLHKFINDIKKEVRQEVLNEERRNLLYSKSSKCVEELHAVIQHLKSIIARESYEDTLLKSLHNPAAEETDGLKITEYRNIIIKMLEQAEILQNAMKVIVCITIEDIDSTSLLADSISSSIKYFVI